MRRCLPALVLLLAGIPVGNPFLRADEAELANTIVRLANSQSAREAEDVLEAALKEFPDSDVIREHRRTVSNAYLSVGKPAEAAAQAVAYLNFHLDLLGRDPPVAARLARAADMASTALLRVGNAEQAGEMIDQSISAVRARRKTKTLHELYLALGELREIKIHFLLKTNHAADARVLLRSELVSAKADHAAAPDDLVYTLRLARLLEREILIADQTAPDTVGALRTTMIEILAVETRKHPNNPPLITMYNSAIVALVLETMQTDPDEAETQIADWKKFVNKLDGATLEMDMRVKFANRNLEWLTGRLGEEKKRLALVGQPAPALHIEDWINGNPLGGEDLEGKVVLLQFGLLSDLRNPPFLSRLARWHEDFAPKGLVIVSIVQYEEFRWDDEAGRLERTKDFSPEVVRQSIVKYAEHYQLKHRFGLVLKESECFEAYIAKELPLFALVDRSGTLRMIRANGGYKQAHDLELMMRKLVKEPAVPPDPDKE